MVNEKVTNLLYKIRTQHNLTQEELAEAIGVTRQTIIAIEKGNYTPSVLLALKISRYFKVPLDSIFKLESDLC